MAVFTILPAEDITTVHTKCTLMVKLQALWLEVVGMGKFSGIFPTQCLGHCPLLYINSTMVQDMLRLPGGSGVPGKMFKDVVSQEPRNAKVMPAYLVLWAMATSWWEVVTGTLISPSSRWLDGFHLSNPSRSHEPHSVIE